MKTLADYVKGYPRVEVLLIARYKAKDNSKYYLCKVEGHNNFYFMKGDEVLDVRYIPGDRFPELSIYKLNHKNDNDINLEIEDCESYKLFVKFIKNETGEIFTI